MENKPQIVDDQYDINPPEHDDYADLFAGLGNDSDEKVLLYRILPGSQKQGLLCRLDVGTSVEDIPPRFGGGDYVIKRLRNGMIMRAVRLFVEGEPHTDAQAKPDTAAAPAAGFDQQGLVAAMQESNRQLLVGLASVLRPAEAPQSRIALIEEFAALKNLFAVPVAPVSNQDPMSMLLKGIELSRSMQPRDGETSGMDVLLESIKSFAPAISEVVKQSKAAPVPGHKPKPPVPAISAPAPPQEADVFKYYINMLVGFAAENRDPQLYADLIADQMPDDQVMPLLDKPDLLGYLASINPEVINHKIWFDSLIAELRKLYELTDQPTGNTVTVENDQPDVLDDKNNGDT